MAEIVKRQHYENRQAGYTDQFTIAYQREDDGKFTIWAEKRPPDPHGDHHQSHVSARTGLVCIAPGKEPRALERAEAFAYVWMQKYSVYVRTGKCPKGTVRVNV